MRTILLSISVVLLAVISLQAQVDKQSVTSRVNVDYFLHDSTLIEIMGFAPRPQDRPVIPGPTLYFTEGDSAQLELFNMSQGAPHTIHLHGLDVDQENDGVPSLSFTVDHMERGYYDFIVPHAGTYIYHCHVISPVHVQGGMYGMLIVKPKSGGNEAWDGGPSYTEAKNWLVSEVDTSWFTPQIMQFNWDTNATYHPVPASYEPGYFLVNGLSDRHVEDTSTAFYFSNASDHLVRIGNIGNMGVRFIFPSSMGCRLISSDGRPLPGFVSTDTFEVYPGERFQVIVNPAVSADSVQLEYFDLNTSIVKGRKSIALKNYWSIESSEEILSLFPNPAQDNFMLPQGLDPSYINIYNVKGEHLRFIYEPGQQSISTAGLENGLYIVELKERNGNVQRAKLIVQH